MKFILIGLTIFVGFSIGNIYAQTKKFKLPLSREASEIATDFKQLVAITKDQEQLSRVKFFIINGEIRKAQRELLKIISEDPNTVDIKLRYQSLIHFINGEYKLSLKTLNADSFKLDKNFAKICILKILNKIIVDDTAEITEDFKTCRKLNFNYSVNDEMWIENLLLLKDRNKDLIDGKKVKSIPAYGYHLPSLKLWLKLAIYLNQEKLFIPLISELPQEAIDSKDVRELIGLIYYRAGDLKNAVKFIEDLKSANAENIKGNIYLNKKYFELAYGQFKLALNKKQNSMNAIERGVALSWMLEQWQDGLELTRRLNIKDGYEPQKLTLEAAFLVNLNQFEDAKRRLERAQSFYGDHPPKELSQLYGFVAIKLKDQYLFNRYLTSACNQWDALSCWLHMQNLIWDNFSISLNRDDKVLSEREFSIDDLRLKVESDELKESKLIDQRDIEEMDEQYSKVVSK